MRHCRGGQCVRLEDPELGAGRGESFAEELGGGRRCLNDALSELLGSDTSALGMSSGQLQVPGILGSDSDEDIMVVWLVMEA